MDEEIKKIQKQIDELKTRRVSQSSVEPGAIKQRHLGESNQYIWAGLEADLPTGAQVTSSTVAYFCTDTFKLKIWTGTVFKSVTLT